MFDLRGTEEQRRLTQAAIDRCDFLFGRLAPQLRSESQREAIVIGWADLATHPRTGQARQHKLGPDVEHRRRVLGEAWTDGLVRIDVSVADDPELAHEVVLSELAHQVDFHYLTPAHREAIWDAYHASEPESDTGDHGHGWFDAGEYHTWIGESFMGGFTRAYSDVTVTLTQFTHTTTDPVARRIREIVTPGLGPPPWNTEPVVPPDPDRPPPPSDPTEPTPLLRALSDLLARLWTWLRNLGRKP